MIKSLTKTLAVLIATASFTYADGGAFFDLKAGMGTWIAGNPSGKIGATEATALDIPTIMGIKGGFTGYFWGEFQHFIPIIPHIRAEYSKMSFQGVPTANLTYGGTTYTITGGTSTMSVDNADVILFYDIDMFDVDINFGVGAKILLGQITTTLDPNTIIPLPGVAAYAYVNLRREIMAGFGAEIEYKWFPDGITPILAFNEYIIKGDYTFDFKFIELGLEAGIRGMTLQISDSSTFFYNQGLGGLFFGGFAKF